MNILKPSYQIEPRDGIRGNLATIERAARTCYKSEGRIGTTDSFVQALIKRGHHAMLEHGDYVFFINDEHVYQNIVRSLVGIMESTGAMPYLTFTNIDGRQIVSGNIRAWREFVATGTAATYYFTGTIDPLYIEDIVPEDLRSIDDHVEPIAYADLEGPVERAAHIRQTVRFIIDRGVSHEFVRHRVMSFAQESQRYVAYDGGLSVIEPCYLTPETLEYDVWKRQCMSAETAYDTERRYELPPQKARAVLPNSTKTELVVTGTLRAWDHFFDLRARQTTGKAHPQAVEVAAPLLREFAERYPDVIRE